jgi:hypothetical protein
MDGEDNRGVFSKSILKSVRLLLEWDFSVLKIISCPTHDVIMHESIEPEMLVLNDVNCFVK